MQKQVTTKRTKDTKKSEKYDVALFLNPVAGPYNPMLCTDLLIFLFVLFVPFVVPRL